MVESEKAKRQRKEDREAKNRARGSRRSGESSSRQGSSRNVGSDPDRDRRRRDRDRDERDAKGRARRNKEEASKPGASFEKSSPRSRSSKSMGNRSSSGSRRSQRDEEERNAKQRAKRTSSSSRPGIESVSTGDLKEARIRRKQSRGDSKRSPRSDGKRSSSRSLRHQESGASARDPNALIAENEVSVPSGAMELTASIVNEDEIDVKTKRLEEMEERLNQRIEEMNNATNDEADNDGEEGEDGKSSKRRWICCAIIVLLLLGGGGAGAYFGLQSSKNEEIPVPPEVVQTTTSPTPSALATSAPVATNMPTALATVGLIYEPPNLDDCNAIARGDPIPGQDEMPVQSHQVVLDVLPSLSTNSSALSDMVENKIRTVIVPELTGCDTVTRYLVEAPRYAGRKLNDPSKYVIANVAVDAFGVEDQSCQELTSDDSCVLISVTLLVTVKSIEVKKFTVIGQITNAFTVESLENKLGLADTVSDMAVVMVSNDISASPSETPSEVPSKGPTVAPTTLSPMSEPTTGVPTSLPSAGPSRVPTKAPTPPPTFAPVVGETPPP
eukprot:CAMPEP_0113641612 /NCGR_PEP_ID=MMETSP0017_2-20120614/21847_1 /TAXON_ID=2856 /ORGANISM="Cylindrotheca closterium" /LENGTH=555 /DNA_ID=CAMNT_0000552967 /DNA_START=253 /DNA_END=1916 /DNA_ORIENTATION=+ /assembly_acc=CAM_ASM_000147